MLNGTLVLGMLLGACLVILTRRMTRRLRKRWQWPGQPRLTYRLGERRRTRGRTSAFPTAFERHETEDSDRHARH